MRVIGFLSIFTLFICRFSSAQLPTLVLQNGHSDDILSMTFTPDGKYLLTGSSDNTIKLWDVQSGLEIKTLSAHTKPVSALAVGGPEGLLVSGGYDNLLCIWDYTTGELLEELDVHAQYINSIAISPDGKYFATTSADFSLILWNMESKKTERIRHKTDFTSVGFSREGHTIYFGSWDNLVYSQNLDESEDITQAKTLKGHDNHVVAVKMSADGRFLASASIANSDEKGKVFLWDFVKGEKKFELGNFPHTLGLHQYKLDITPDSRYVVAVGYNGHTISFYDIATGKATQKIEESETINAIAVSPDGKLLAVAVENQIHFWELEKNQLIKKLSGNSLTVHQIAWREPHQLQLLADKQLLTWNLKTGMVINLSQAAATSENAPEYSPDGKWRAERNEVSVSVYEVATNKKVKEFTDLADYIFSMAFSPDGKHLALASKDLELYEISSWKKTNQLKGHKNISNILFSPDGKTLASLGGPLDRSLKIWEVSTGVMKASFAARGNDQAPLAFSADGRYVANGGKLDVNEPGIVNVWDLNTNELHAQYQNPPLDNAYNFQRGVNCLAFSPDGKTLAAGNTDHIIRLWNLQSKRRTELKGHEGEVLSLTYSPDGNFLVSTGMDGAVRIWDTKTSTETGAVYLLKENNWAVIKKNGLFDASPDAMRWLHYVVGLETIELNQLKERYYEPGLLQKLLGWHDEPVRDVDALGELQLFPQIELRTEGDKLLATFKERPGGIGRVSFFINGKEVLSDIQLQPEKNQTEIFSASIDLNAHTRFFSPNTENSLGIRATNKNGSLTSKLHEMDYFYKPEKVVVSISKNPKLFAIVIGTSDYRGEQLDLKFADKDAQDIAQAMTASGEQLLGINNVKVKLLHTGMAENLPTKQNIKKSFEEFAIQATPNDVVVVYLSGHGVNHGGQDGMFYYLTKDIASGDLSDDAIRNNYAISTGEFTEWLKLIPAQKQVMILDACASGKLVEDLLGTKNVSSSQIRALERLKDRTGMFIIAGSAADMVSYEASQFGQSLLTYSLLLGMSGAALRDKEFVDVLTLFQFAADKVPEFARNIGGVQKPVVAAPDGLGSFDIGKVNTQVKIPLGKIKPLFLRSSFLDTESMDDALGLSEALDDRLRNISAKGKEAPLIFIDTKQFPNARYVNGLYSVAGGQVSLKAKIFELDDQRDRKMLGEFDVTGSSGDVQRLVDEVLVKVQEVLAD